MTKPPYRVPLMAEIAAIKPNGFKVASTFAGAGGSSLGYRMAGFEVAYANEFVPIAQESYRANASPHTQLDGRDVRQVKAEEILKMIGMRPGELDVFDGSPPCQAFSTAGQRDKGWGKDKRYQHGAEQRNEELFFDYIRLRDGLMPRTFVAENVSGLVKGKAKGFFLEILDKLKNGGEYRVIAGIVDAQWLGVPQQRERVIFVGVRADLELEPVLPDPLPYQYSVRDALAGLGADDVEPETDISRYAIGVEYDRLIPGRQSDKYFNLIKADPSKPCPALLASAGQYLSGAYVVHPVERRKFSIREAKRISSFPDDFELKGTYGEQWERLGNSVPPLMMERIAATLRDRVLIPAGARRVAGRRRRA